MFPTELDVLFLPFLHVVFFEMLGNGSDLEQKS